MTDDIQHEQHHDELAQFLEFLKTHGKTALFVIVVSVTLATSIAFFQSNKEKNNVEAARLFSTAASPQDFQSLIDKYPSAEIAPVVLLGLAKSFYSTMNFTMALRKYEEFQQAYPEHDLVAASEMGRIHCIEAVGRKQEALVGFTSFIQKNPKHYMIPQAKLGAARCTEQIGNYKEAKTLYEDFMAEYEDSDWGSLAEQRLRAVKHKLEHGDTAPDISTLNTADPSLILPPTMQMVEP